jgi:hypothetical protein
MAAARRASPSGPASVDTAGSSRSSATLRGARAPSGARGLRLACGLSVAAALSGCAVDAPLPFVGDCAVYPEGTYNFGEIGIGSCLAGPSDLVLTDDLAGAPVVLVVNANPYKVFDTANLLAIPWSEIDAAEGEVMVDDLSTGGMELPDFAAGLGLLGDVGLVAVRKSEGALVRQSFDDVKLLDLSDPMSPRASDRGPDGGDTLQVESDPFDIEVDPTSGYAFVANRTSHSVSVIDGSGDTLRVVRPWPEHVITRASFEDTDGDGSQAAMDDLSVIDTALLIDERWSLDWIEGTWRLWLPEEGGLRRHTSVDAARWTPSPSGRELDADLSSVIEEVVDPAAAAGRMYFSDNGVLRAASATGSASISWAFEGEALLEPRGDGWEGAALSGPAPLITADLLYLFYDGVGEGLTATPAIGAAASADGSVFTRLAGPLLEPQWDHDRAGLSDPAPVFDPETGLIVVYYTAFDGERLRIGRAEGSRVEELSTDAEAAFAIDGVDVAAPVISAEVGRWTMWYSRREAGIWSVGLAESPDGLRWTDRGTALALPAEVATADAPPTVALQAAPEGRFRVVGENQGNLLDPVVPGEPFAAALYGWQAVTVAGYAVDVGAAGAESARGVRVDSADLDLGLAWLTLTSAGGVNRIGLAEIGADGELQVQQGAIFEGSSGFDRGGVSAPVVWRHTDGSFRMAYAGERGGRKRVGVARSDTGRTWTRIGLGLDVGDDWESSAVEPGSVEVLDDGRVRLWYAGFDGEVWRVGSALSEDGETFVREPRSARGYAMTTGRPGDWDDSGVRHPWVLRGSDGDGQRGRHIWYTGFDGDLWRLGYAFLRDGEDTPARYEDEDGVSVPVLLAEGGLFSPQGVQRPVLLPTEGLLGGDQGYVGWYAGLGANRTRIGGLSSSGQTRLHRGLNRPSAGDRLVFSTERGDPNARAIPLDTGVEDSYLTGIGLTSVTMDVARGFLYAASKLVPYLFVIDVRDDSTVDFNDLNYLDLEAVLPVTNATGGAGFRQVMTVPGEDRLIGLHSGPESVWSLDISGVEDNAFAEFVYDTTASYMPAHRGVARDVGADTDTDVGPAGMAMHPDGQRLFVTGFNTNNLMVYDLTLGTRGMLVGEVPNVGENPAAILLSPDGKKALVANHAGELFNVREGNRAGTQLASATLAVVDIDPTSPSYLSVIAWIKNR